VGGKNFTEQDVLAELVAQQIERRTTLSVDRRLHLGGTFVCHRAITTGGLDLYVEYTGTALTAILARPPLAEPDSVLAYTARVYREQWDLEWLVPLGFDNTFVLVMRPDDAERLDIRSISDLAGHAAGLTAGFGFEFEERPDGYRGLSERYSLEFRSIRTMELGLLYRALTDGQIDIAVGSATDGLIAALGLTVLDDDLAYFPPYEAAPVARRDMLEAHPEVREALEELGGLLDERAMRHLNYEVDGARRPVEMVVRAWLDSLLPSEPPR
jgi:glycine betaine/choline ABC-type transport system substrate-binding protein